MGAWTVDSSIPTTAITKNKLKNKGKPRTRKKRSRLMDGASSSGVRKGKLIRVINNMARSEAIPAAAITILKPRK